MARLSGAPRPRKRPGGNHGLIPKSTLSSTQSTTQKTNSRIETPNRSSKLLIESDSQLLLKDRSDRRRNTYRSHPNRNDNDNDRSSDDDMTKDDDNIWNKSFESKAIVHRLSDLKTTIALPENTFSDEESNDLTYRTESILDISDFIPNKFKNDDKITKIQFVIQKLTLGYRDAILETDSTRKVFGQVSRDLKTFALYESTSNSKSGIISINPLRGIKNIYNNDSSHSILVFTSSKTETGNITKTMIERFAFTLSSGNYSKFLKLWPLLINKFELTVPLELEALDAMALKNSLEKKELLPFGKSFNSLKNPRTSSTRSPSQKISSTKFYSVKEPSSPSLMGVSRIPIPLPLYKSTTTSDSPLGLPFDTTKRKLRSSSISGNYTADSPYVVEDLDTPPKKKRAPKEPFEPPLNYTFTDNSLFEIRNKDFGCLYGSEWINDTLIDFFIKYYYEEAVKNDEGNDKIINGQVLSTFFMYKLKSSKSHYQNIERWVSKLDLLNKEFVILPVNESLHWFCAIIYNLKALLTGEGTVKIYIFDSLKQKHSDLLMPLTEFLIDYAKDKYEVTAENHQIELINAQVPKQPNFNDCGIHVIYNVMKFLKDPKKCVDLWDKNLTVTREISDFFNRSERNKMRQTLMQLLRSLLAEQQKDKDPTDPNISGSVKENKEIERNQESDDEIQCIEASEFMKFGGAPNDSPKLPKIKETSNEIKDEESKRSEEDLVPSEAVRLAMKDIQLSDSSSEKRSKSPLGDNNDGENIEENESNEKIQSEEADSISLKESSKENETSNIFKTTSDSDSHVNYELASKAFLDNYKNEKLKQARIESFIQVPGSQNSDITEISSSNIEPEIAPKLEPKLKPKSESESEAESKLSKEERGIYAIFPDSPSNDDDDDEENPKLESTLEPVEPVAEGSIATITDTIEKIKSGRASDTLSSQISQISQLSSGSINESNYESTKEFEPESDDIILVSPTRIDKKGEKKSYQKINSSPIKRVGSPIKRILCDRERSTTLELEDVDVRPDSSPEKKEVDVDLVDDYNDEENNISFHEDLQKLARNASKHQKRNRSKGKSSSTIEITDFFKPKPTLITSESEGEGDNEDNDAYSEKNINEVSLLD